MLIKNKVYKLDKKNKKITLNNSINIPMEKLQINFNGIKEIVFGSEYDKPFISLSSTSSVIKITFGHKFNHPVSNLPENLEFLAFVQGFEFFGSESIFNLPVSNLPMRLKYLHLSDKFNLPIDNLPEGLIELYLGNSFSHNLNDLPIGLEKLSLGKKTNCELLNLPPNLSILIIQSILINPIIKLPLNLSNLIFKQSYTKDLSVVKFNNEFMKLTIDKVNVNLPNNIYYVEIINLKLPNLHKSLKGLICNHMRLDNDDFNSLPNSLIKIHFLNYCDIFGCIKNLPRNLIEIKFANESEFNDIIIPTHLPNTLEILEFGHHFNKIVNNKNLPNGLKHLKLGHSYNNDILDLPDSIEYLHIYNNSIKIINLPKNLKQIHLIQNYLPRFQLLLLNYYNKFEIKYIEKYS